MVLINLMFSGIIKDPPPEVNIIGHVLFNISPLLFRLIPSACSVLYIRAKCNRLICPREQWDANLFLDPITNLKACERSPPTHSAIVALDEVLQELRKKTVHAHYINLIKNIYLYTLRSFYTYIKIIIIIKIGTKISKR